MFQDLLIWQKAKDLTLLVYKIFNQNKDFNFKKQIERASVCFLFYYEQYCRRI